MKNPKDFKNILEIRNCIDEIDFQIMKLFGDRNRCVEEIVNFKTGKAEIIANERQKEVIALRREWAANFDLDPDLFERIFKLIIKGNIQKELRLSEQKQNKFIN